MSHLALLADLPVGRTLQVQAPVRRRCVRCEILASRLDRAGRCLLCQYEEAYGRVFVNWRLFRRELAKRPRLRQTRTSRRVGG